MMAPNCRSFTRIILTFSLVVVIHSFCFSQVKPTVLFQNPSNFERQNEWVEYGASLPRDWNVTDGGELSIQDETNNPVPAQFAILSRWGAGRSDERAPAKWVLVGMNVSVNASSNRTYSLARNGSAVVTQPLAIDDSQTGKMIVDTRAARFELNVNQDFNLFDQVTIEGTALLERLAAREAIHYSPDGTIDIAGKSGSLDLSQRKTRVQIERSGPLSAIVKVEGSILNDASQAILDYTARLHFSLGSAAVRVDFTVENNLPIIEGEGGQPGNTHNQGAVNSVYIGDLSLNLKLKGNAERYRILAENGVSIQSTDTSVRLYQDSSGTETWNVYTGEVGWPGYEASAHPRLQSYCAKNGFTIFSPTQSEIASGRQSLGWMTLVQGETNAPRLTTAIRDFWQNFPKAVEANANGILSVNLFPNGNQFHHNFRVGEEKTHTVLFDFGLGSISTKSAEQIAETFNKPLLAVVSPDWILHSGVLGEVPPVNSTQWPLYEDYVRVAFEPSTIYDPEIHSPNFGNTTLTQAIERYNFYGWQDYGDVPIDYEAFGDNQAGQLNLKYWFLYGLFAQFCRSGDTRWFDLARPAAWHMADIDHLHIPDEGIQHWAHGAYFGHSQHDEPGNLNPNRNGNSPSVDLVFGVPDLLLGYYVTGEQRFADTALEAIQSYVSMMEFADFTTEVEWEPVIQRARGNLIFAFLEVYKFTGDAQWLKSLDSVVQSVVDLSNKEWLTDPTAYGLAHPRFSLKIFCFTQTLWTVGRYMDFLQECSLPDTLHITEALRAYGDFIIRYLMQEYPVGSGRAVHPYEYFFDGSDSSYLDVNNWTLVMADALAYIYKYTGEARFLDAAERFYQTGVTDAVFENDPPVYLATKDLVNALNWGLVYMNQANRVTSIPGREWMLHE